MIQKERSEIYEKNSVIICMNLKIKGSMYKKNKKLNNQFCFMYNSYVMTVRSELIFLINFFFRCDTVMSQRANPNIQGL